MAAVTLESIMDKLTSMSDSIESLKDTVNQCNVNISACNEKQDSILPRIETLERDMAVVKREVTSLKERNIQLEAYVRRDNLIFGGLTESDPDDCANKIRLHIQNNLKIPTNEMKFTRVHRLGRKQPGKTRPIIVRFHYYGDRMQVWKNRKELKGHTHWIAEDFPPEIQERRRILKHILRSAIDLDPRKPEDINDIFLVADRLTINGVTYTINNLRSLPEHLRPEKLSTPQIGEKVVAFYNELSPFSNFYPAKFTHEGVEYLHVEQFFCAKKAEITERPDVKHSIMQQVSPLKCKALAKNLPNSLEWKRNQEQIMTIGCEAKFQQNAWLGDFLRKTGELSLIETRSDDKFWGAGVAHSDPQIAHDKYPGKNKLGKILMDIRSKLD
jgi:ribA/ribD-fused uncharacterized protein